MAEPQKQKILIGVTVVVVLIVIWQFYGLMGGGGSEAVPAATTPVAADANKPALPGAPTTMPGVPGGGNPAAATQAVTSTTVQAKNAPVPINSELLRLQQQTQTEYIASLNKLQMLKLQREIDETKTAIATTELSRMTAERNIADIITSTGDEKHPTQPAPVATQVVLGQQPNVGNAAAPSGTPAEITYSVLSVTYQDRKWTAVVNSQGKTYSVNVGDIIPPESWMVVGIDKKGVTMRRNSVLRVLTFTSSM